MDDDDIFDATGQDDSPAPVVERTVLDSLQNELQRAIANDPITLSVPNRPNVSLVFDTNIESGKLQLWRKVCVDKQMSENFDGLKFSSIVIANQCETVLFDGNPVNDDDGKRLNFRNQALLDMLSSKRAVPAVRRMYGSDGHIFIAADAILRAAGYDSDEQDQSVTDPTLLT